MATGDQEGQCFPKRPALDDADDTGPMFFSHMATNFHKHFSHKLNLASFFVAEMVAPTSASLLTEGPPSATRRGAVYDDVSSRATPDDVGSRAISASVISHSARIATVQGDDTTAETTIPQKLWLFWDTDPPPEVVDACISRLRRLNPGWEMRVLHLGHDLVLSGLVPPPPIAGLENEHISDWYRINVIARFGGVW